MHIFRFFDIPPTPYVRKHIFRTESKQQNAIFLQPPPFRPTSAYVINEWSLNETWLVWTVKHPTPLEIDRPVIVVNFKKKSTALQFYTLTKLPWLPHLYLHKELHARTSSN